MVWAKEEILRAFTRCSILSFRYNHVERPSTAESASGDKMKLVCPIIYAYFTI